MKTRDITVSVTCRCENAPARPATAPEGDEPVTDEPAVGDLLTDCGGGVWQRFEDGWRWWKRGAGAWSPCPRTWDYVQTIFDPARATTDDDRRRVGLPVRDENTPPASRNAPQDARSADSGTGRPPEPENGAQGRIGWIRLKPADERRLLTREVPGGWTDTDLADDDLFWTAENWPNAEFTPIRTLADDEVAVKREDLRTVLRVTEIFDAFGGPSLAATRLRAALDGDA